MLGQLDHDALRPIQQAMAEAQTPADWRATAAAWDAVSGAADWRRTPGPTPYDAAGLTRAISTWAERRAAADPWGLAAALEEHLQRHLVDLADPGLYVVARSGPPLLVEAFFAAAEEALLDLADRLVPPAALASARARMEAHARLFGRSALLLSGGATWGFHHLGVVKALFDEGLLPEILSGASTGAMIAAGVCTRDDDGLRAMFDDLGQLRRDGLRAVAPRLALSRRALLDPQRLYEVLLHNVGPATFAEAHAQSRRVLNISVSSPRRMGKPRLLTHLTAPDVLVARAALASSALPGLFPAVELRQRPPGGVEGPAWPGELWVDGSLQADLPKQRLARLHNVNHFIVSQTNPHVVPFAQDRPGGGLRRQALAALTSAAWSQGTIAAELIQRAGRGLPGTLGQLSEQAHLLLRQDYHGDIELHPPLRPDIIPKLVSNPTPAELAQYVLDGERTVWPKLPQLRDQTRIGRAFSAAVQRLRAREAAEGR
jgi:NTE family protein